MRFASVINAVLDVIKGPEVVALEKKMASRKRARETYKRRGVGRIWRAFDRKLRSIEGAAPNFADAIRYAEKAEFLFTKAFDKRIVPQERLLETVRHALGGAELSQCKNRIIVYRAATDRPLPVITTHPGMTEADVYEAAERLRRDG